MLMTNIRKKMKTGIWILVAVFIGGIFFVFGMSRIGKFGDSQKQKKLSKYVLDIDGTKIPRDLFDYEFQNMVEVYRSYGMTDLDSYQSLAMIKYITIRQILKQQLFIREAEKKGINVTSGEINSKIRADRDRLLGPTPESTNPSLPGRIKNYFAQSRKDKEFRSVLSRRGIRFASYKLEIWRILMAEKIASQIGKDLETEEAKKVEQKALDVWKKLEKNETFESIAKQYSEDVATKDSEGFLGWKTRADLDPALVNEAFKMTPGSFSRPIHTGMGFQIIRVEAVKHPSGLEYETYRDNLIKQTKPGQPPPAERDIQRQYESVLLKHILLRVKDGKTLVEDWTDKQIKNKNKFKYEILDPEINAFEALQNSVEAGGEKGPSQKGLERALKTYEKTLEGDASNFNLYFMIGFIYEQQDKAVNEKKDKKGDKTDNIYETEKSKLKKRNNKYLKPALDSYKKAYDMATEQGSYNIPDIILGVARISKELADSAKDKKDAKKYRDQSKNFYTEAIDFSYNNMRYLKEIEGALQDFGDKKDLKEVTGMISDLEQQYNESQGASAPAPAPKPRAVETKSGAHNIVIGDDKQGKKAAGNPAAPVDRKTAPLTGSAHTHATATP
jgi:hypothetical protein